MKFSIQSTVFASLVLLVGTAAAAPVGDEAGDLNVSRILAENSRANVQVEKRQVVQFDSNGVATATAGYTPYTPGYVGTPYRRS
jgi:hypothetical protein